MVHEMLLTDDQITQHVDAGLLTPAQAFIVQCVNDCNGMSLDHRGHDLRVFLARGLDNPLTLIDKHVSTCGLFALAVYHRLGVPHKLLKTPYHTGMAITWLYQIANDLKAIRHPIKDGPPKPGALMHYFTAGKKENDSHVEFCLSTPKQFESVWIAFHGGGGRSNCGITVGHSDVHWSSGRPLQEWYDVDALVSTLDETDVAPTVADAEFTEDNPPE